jgi:hypothetical protein
LYARWLSVKRTNGWVYLAGAPQRLKPIVEGIFYGTTEVVPLPVFNATEVALSKLQQTADAALFQIELHELPLALAE